MAVQDFSFDNIKTRILTNLRKQVDWAQILPTSTNVYLINAFAEELEGFAYYLEKTARNNRWKYSKSLRSMVGQSQLYNGYEPHRKIGANGKLRVSGYADAFPSLWLKYITYSEDNLIQYDGRVYKCLASNINSIPTNSGNTDWVRIPTTYFKTISIPKWTTFSTNDGLVYSCYEASSLAPTDDWVEISIVQGIPKSVSFTLVGDPFEEIHFNIDNIDKNTHEFYVNGEKFTVIKDILDAKSNEKKYQIVNKTDFSGVIVILGNKDNGYQSTVGDQYEFRYVETLGAQGNISSEGMIRQVNSTVLDVDGNIVNTISCYNSDEISGGKNYETIEEIRVNAPRALHASDNLLSKLDYEVALERDFSFISKSVVWGAIESNEDNGNALWEFIPSTENLIKFSAFTPGTIPLQLNDSQKIEIINQFKDKKSSRDIIQFVDVEFVGFQFNITAYLNDTSILFSEMSRTIRERFIDIYSIDQFDFKENLYESAYKAEIQKIEGIQSHTSFIEFYENVPFSVGDLDSLVPYQAAGFFKLPEIDKETVKIYYRNILDVNSTWILIGKDNGQSTFTAEPGFDLTGSTINYTDGSFSIVESSGISGVYGALELLIVSQPLKSDLILSKRNQIQVLR